VDKILPFSVNQRAIRKLLTWLPQSAIVKRPSDCESQKRSFVLEAPHFGQLERKRRLACAPRRVNVELGCWSEISNSTPKSFFSNSRLRSKTCNRGLPQAGHQLATAAERGDYVWLRRHTRYNDTDTVHRVGRYRAPFNRLRQG
jgi:hypothetical protein